MQTYSTSIHNCSACTQDAEQLTPDNMISLTIEHICDKIPSIHSYEWSSVLFCSSSSQQFGETRRVTQNCHYRSEHGVLSVFPSHSSSCMRLKNQQFQLLLQTIICCLSEPQVIPKHGLISGLEETE